MSQEVAKIIDNSVALFKGMPDVLRANESKVEKAEEVGMRIKEAIAAAGGVITPELDERMQKYIVNCNSAKKGMMDSRAPFTQIMTEMAKMFTLLESKIDNSKAGTLSYEFQQHRNIYATRIAQEAEQKRKEAEAQAAKNTEAIQLKAEVQNQLQKYFNDFLLFKKQNMTNAFNGVLLGGIDELQGRLANFKPAYSLEHFNAFTHNVSGKYHNAAAVTFMIDKAAAFADFEEQYAKEMTVLCEDLISKLPSKRQELQDAEIARKAQEAADKEAAEAKNEADKKAAEERADALKKQQEEAVAATKEREEREAEELKKAAAEKEEADKLKISIGAQSEVVGALFETEQSLSQTVEAPESRGGYEISVINPAGWMQVFSFWFEREGKSLPDAKIEKTTMLQMKSFCEKWAHKNDEKIDHKYLEYKIVHKAVNRKEKP